MIMKSVGQNVQVNKVDNNVKKWILDNKRVIIEIENQVFINMR